MIDNILGFIVMALLGVPLLGAIILMWSVTFDVFTGVDLVREYIRPFIQSLL